MGHLNLLLFRILYIPLLANCALTISLTSGSLEILGQIISAAIFIGLTSIGIYDKTYKTTLNWFCLHVESMGRYDTISRQYSLEAAGILMTCLVANDIFAIPMLVLYIVTIFGLFIILISQFPYHVLRVNKFYIMMAIVRVWIAMILLTARLLSFNDPDDLFGLSVLFIITPLLMLIINYLTN